MEVVINGHIMSLQGDASEEHMQKVAKVINEKLEEIQKAYGKAHLPVSKVSQLLTLNLADEYVKKQEVLDDDLVRLEKISKENEALKTAMSKLEEENMQLKEKMSEKVQTKNHTNHANRGR